MRLWVAALLSLLVGCTAEPAADRPPDPSASVVDPPASPRASPEPTTPVMSGAVEGADVSWPQCPKGMGIPARRGQGQPMPPRSARFVVVGLTNGPAFHPNPCLSSQVTWLRRRGLAAAAYAVANYPSERRLAEYGGSGPYPASSRLGRLRNVGYHQASFNLATMHRAGLQSPVVWIDVEPYPLFPWSRSTRGNLAVVEGIVHGYSESGYQVGFYSTQNLWREVLGDARFGLPEWRTAGRLTRAEALARCGPTHSFQGGGSVIAQWYTDRRDFDVTCPGTVLTDWFHQY